MLSFNEKENKSSSSRHRRQYHEEESHHYNTRKFTKLTHLARARACSFLATTAKDVNTLATVASMLSLILLRAGHCHWEELVCFWTSTKSSKTVCCLNILNHDLKFIVMGYIILLNSKVKANWRPTWWYWWYLLCWKCGVNHVSAPTTSKLDSCSHWVLEEDTNKSLTC